MSFTGEPIMITNAGILSYPDDLRMAMLHALDVATESPTGSIWWYVSDCIVVAVPAGSGGLARIEQWAKRFSLKLVPGSLYYFSACNDEPKCFRQHGPYKGGEPSMVLFARYEVQS